MKKTKPNLPLSLTLTLLYLTNVWE